MAVASEQMDAARAHVAVVTPVVPGTGSRNGLAYRLFHMMRALADVAEVTLFLPVDAAVLDDAALARWGEVDGMTVRPVLDMRARGPATSAGRWCSRVRGIALTRWPRWSQPRRSPELAQYLATDAVDVLCLHLPITAHLAWHAPRHLPIVWIFEEALDRDLLAVPLDGSRLRQVLEVVERLRTRRLYRRLGRRAVLIIAISKEEAAHLVELGIDRSRVMVLPHGVDPVEFAPMLPDEGAPKGDAEVDVAVFGDFRFSRNLAPTIEAILWSVEHQAGLRWMIVGEIEAEAAARLRAKGALVTGAVEDVRPFYRQCRVVLVPADAGTGVKTTLLQAWSMERPVVASMHATRGVPARAGVNLVIGRSTEELVAACLCVVGDPGFASKLAREGRSTILAERDITRIARRFAAASLSAAVGRSSPQRPL